MPLKERVEGTVVMPKGRVVWEYCPRHPEQKRTFRANGKRRVCVLCVQEYNKNYATRLPGGKRDYHEKDIRRKYGLTVAEKEARWLAQGKRCAICRQEIALWGRGKGSAMVDHDHSTNKVRGLLCTDCNTAIGHFAEDGMRMLAAAKYLGGDPCSVA